MRILTDTHAHLNDEAFDEDRKAVIDELQDKLKWIINNSYDEQSCDDSVKLAEEYDFIYAAVGIHPHDASTYCDELENKLSEYLNHPKVVALGEIGLDYHYDLSPRDIQKEVFVKQIALAEKFDKPITIHSRDAAQDTFDILKSCLNCRRGAVLHSFSQSSEMFKLYLDMNVFFSISGVVTFKNADKLRETVKLIPIDRMFIETDCPYMTPVPFRGKRNRPDMTEYTARVCAELKGMAYENFCEKTAENAEKFFGFGI